MKENLVDKAYSLISVMIFKYQLPPGSKVSDYTLSKNIGISRTPIRNALQLLVSDGLLEIEGSKYKVPNITAERIDNIYDARIYIQSGILRLAMKKGISAEDLDSLRLELGKEISSMKDGNIYESITHDLNFNMKLCTLCGNPFLIKNYVRLEKQTKLLIYFGMLYPSKSGLEDYKRICDCIEKKDVEGACEALIGHIEDARNQKKQILNNNQEDIISQINLQISNYYPEF